MNRMTSGRCAGCGCPIVKTALGSPSFTERWVHLMPSPRGSAYHSHTDHRAKPATDNLPVTLADGTVVGELLGVEGIPGTSGVALTVRISPEFAKLVGGPDGGYSIREPRS